MTRPFTAAIYVSLLLVFCVGNTAMHAQNQEQQLVHTEATWPESFGSIMGLLERPDGRVLVADPLGQILVLLDLENGTADTIGRIGSGPEEYRQPDGLFDLPGDSVLLVDLGNGRLTALGPDHGFGETWTIAQTAGGMGRGGGRGMASMTMRLPVAVDSRGRVYFRGRQMMRPGAPMPDSSYMLRWDRASDAVDTLGMLKDEDRIMSTRGGSNSREVNIQPVPMSPQDGWAVGRDGRIAAVRSVDYHVAWIGADGDVVSGQSNDYRKTRLRRVDKEAFFDRQQRAGIRIGMTMENGVMSTSMSRGGGRPGERNLGDYEWPDELPAFQPGGIRVAPNGEVWVERYTTVGSETMYDVFDGTGSLQRRITLPEGRQVVGFGDNAVYVTRLDEFDLVWLEKYSLR